MKILTIIRKTVASACVYFTAAEFIILAVAEMFSLTSPAEGGSVRMFLSLGSTALIFLACLLFSLLNLVWRLDLSLTVRTVLHFTGSLLIWALVFIIIPGVYTDTAQIIARTIVFALLYAVIGAAALIVHVIKRNRASDASEYTPAYSANDKRQGE